MSAVRRLIAAHVNVDCTPNQVYYTHCIIMCILCIYFSILMNNIIIMLIVHSQSGWTPLMTASFEGHIAIVRLLVEAKAQVNKQTEV